MNAKMCLIVLLCLLSISIAYNAAITALSTPAPSNHSSNNKPIAAKYLTLSDNLTEPDGKDKGGGGWPQ